MREQKSNERKKSDRHPPSNDGTFQKGDHITFYEDGTIGCREAKGWIDSCDVAKATKGMEYKWDIGYYKRQLALAQLVLDEIKSED